jgi:hypothetical protein
VCGILSGNINIVRVPSKDFEQVTIICDAIQKLSLDSQFHSITNRIALVRYDRQNSATAYFSSICDVRIIWGGDSTIQEIRRHPIPPRSFDVTFADRYSLCVINADIFIHEPALEKIANGFYNDTYLFDQNACTAPHLLVWLGESKNVEKARELFWNALYNFVKSNYSMQSVIAVDKLTSLYFQAATYEGIKKETSSDNLLWRISLENLSKDIENYRCSSGYFLEFHAASINEIAPIVNRKYQTLAYYGLEKKDLHTFMQKNTPLGIDRIVPIGKTTDFSLTWDGYELITTLSRICAI